MSQKEIQHFRSIGDNPNYYRFTVKSKALMTGEKYSSDFYDEKALDIFLNEFGTDNEQEVKREPAKEKHNGNKGIQIKPIYSEGVYAYIFSTNADQIADTIGAFAESQVAADHINALVNREKFMVLDEKQAELDQKD